MSDVISLDEQEPGPCKHGNARIINDNDERWCPECGSLGENGYPGKVWTAPDIVVKLATVRSVAGFLSGQLQATRVALTLAEAGVAPAPP